MRLNRKHFKVVDFVVVGVSVYVMDFVAVRHRAVVLFPNVYVESDSLRSSIRPFYLAEPITFSVSVKTLSVIFYILDNFCLGKNLHKIPPFFVYTIISQCNKICKCIERSVAVKISTIRRIGIAPVYNMTVKEHHNFMVAGNVILHNCDAVRYYCVSRVLPAEPEKKGEEEEWEDEDDNMEDYNTFMCGGEASAAYITG